MTTTASSADRAHRLGELSIVAAGCTRCGLAAGRTNVVFGYGDPDAALMIVGEGPGKNEDEQGLPFVGRSGQLLDQMLDEIGLRREDNVYIANVVKCRPPGNRDPRQEEIDACKDYLREQLRLVDPLVVVTLGNFSSKLLMRTETGITRLRGQAYEWWGRFLVPTFHPAAALRGSASVLAAMRDDFRLVAEIVSGERVYEGSGVGRSADQGTAGPPERDPGPEPTAAVEPHDQLGLFQ